jgi:hypothetical protein
MALVQVRAEALQAKQSMFARHSASEKALREHKEQLAAAKEEAAAQKALNETLRANAKNLRQQISSLKVSLLFNLHGCNCEQYGIFWQYSNIGMS